MRQMQRWYISAWQIKREECFVRKIKTTLHGHNWRIWTMIVNGQWWSTTNQQANWEWFRMSDLKCLRHHQVWIWNLSQWSQAMISTCIAETQTITRAIKNLGEADQSNKIRESKMRSVQRVLKTVDAGREIVWIDRVMRKVWHGSMFEWNWKGCKCQGVTLPMKSKGSSEYECVTKCESGREYHDTIQ